MQICQCLPVKELCIKISFLTQALTIFFENGLVILCFCTYEVASKREEYHRNDNDGNNNRDSCSWRTSYFYDNNNNKKKMSLK